MASSQVRFVLFALIFGSVVLLTPTQQLYAHTIDAPSSVQADVAGCFSFSSTFTVGMEGALLSAIFVNGFDNTTVQSYIADYLCQTTLPEGETISDSFSGCLADPTLPGSVTITFSFCGEEDLVAVVDIAPCVDSFEVPAVIVAGSDGAWQLSALFTAGCTGSALAGWQSFGIENVGAGLVADAFCATPLQEGEEVSIPFSGLLIDPSQPGTVAISISSCSAFFTTEVTILPEGAVPFLRGDVDNDGLISAIPDGLSLLLFGFSAGTSPACLAAADVDGNGQLEPLQDALYLLNFGFTGGPPPVAPFPTCGVDPAGSSLSCDASACTP